MNDKVFKNLDTIYAAIAANKQITFQYLHWNPQRKLVAKAGKVYIVSPYSVSLADDNYLENFQKQSENEKAENHIFYSKPFIADSF